MPCLRRVLGRALPLALSLVLLALAPFAVALEVHHELAAADQDGHQHSDTDLCQWVQHHTGTSLITDAPAVLAWEAPVQWSQPAPGFARASHSDGSSVPRAPPVS